MNNSNIPVLGIDVSKEELVIFNSSSRQIVKAANSEAGLKKFLSSLDKKKLAYQIALESTGDYSYLPMKFFLKQGFIVKLINPIVTGKAIKSTVRGKKTDNGVNLSQAVSEIDQLIKEVDQKAKNSWQLTEKKEPARQEQIIDSHVGYGTKLSKIISEEAGDIKRFPSSSQFKAYVGIDPKIIQSTA